MSKIKKLISALANGKLTEAQSVVSEILLVKIHDKLEESKKVVVVRGMKKKKMFKKVAGKRVDQKTGRETRISGADKAKFKKSSRIGARKRKATKIQANRKRKLSKMKR